MVFDLPMVTNDNDPNDPLPFITLGCHTLNVMRYLSQQKPDSAEENGADKEKADASHREKAKRDAIAERVAAIERFERIVSGKDRLRRKRNY